MLKNLSIRLTERHIRGMYYVNRTITKGEIMKPLKATQQIVESNKWVRIDYLTENEHAFGYYILKSDLYLNNVKKFDKVLKNCSTAIITDYKVTMKDIIISAIDTIKDKIYYLNRKIEREKSRTFPCLLDIRLWVKEFYKYQYMLKRLENKL